MKLTEESKELFSLAESFDRDTVKKVNPKAGTVDQMFAWGITPHCETSHEGMRKKGTL